MLCFSYYLSLCSEKNFHFFLFCNTATRLRYHSTTSFDFEKILHPDCKQLIKTHFVLVKYENILLIKTTLQITIIIHKFSTITYHAKENNDH